MIDDPASFAKTDAKAQGEWWGGDIPVAQLTDFIERSKKMGWRPVLDEVSGSRKQFAHRLRNFRVGNWHLVRALPGDGVALDVGCGFGALALGLSEHFRQVVGVDALWTRVSYGNLRAREDDRKHVRFVQGGGFALPFRSATFDLVTMNGVLEWAALYAPGEPRQLQVAMLREARRVLKPGGTLAVAIENRYAMETLVGMDDTHTGLRLVPALPRPLAGLVSRFLRRQPYRTFLYDADGYRSLYRDAGFEDFRILDLASSYNDYDFVISPGDRATYQLLWKAGIVRTFYKRAGSARRYLARLKPDLLGRFAYSYLLVGGRSVPTLLDSDHPFWQRAKVNGIAPGAARFACQGASPGTIAIVTHDGTCASGAIELSTTSSTHATPILSDALANRLGLTQATKNLWEVDGIRASWRGPRTPSVTA